MFFLFGSRSASELRVFVILTLCLYLQKVHQLQVKVIKMVFVNKVLHLGHEKDVSCVKQGSEMSNHCLRQDQGLMVSVEHPHPNLGFWEAKSSLPKHVCFVLLVRILEKLVSHTVDQTLNGVLSSINLLVHFELKTLFPWKFIIITNRIWLAIKSPVIEHLKSVSAIGHKASSRAHEHLLSRNFIERLRRDLIPDE